MVKINSEYLKYELNSLNQFKVVSVLIINISALILFWDKHLSFYEKKKKNNFIAFNRWIYDIGYFLIVACFLFNLSIIFSLSLRTDILSKIITELNNDDNIKVKIFEKDVNLIVFSHFLIKNKKMRKYYQIHINQIKFFHFVKTVFRLSVIFLIFGSFLLLIPKLIVFKNKLILYLTYGLIIITLIHLTYTYIIHSRDKKILDLNTKLFI